MTTERGSTAPATATVSIISRAELQDMPCWAGAFGDQRKDRRYYELLEDTILAPFDYRYFAIRNPDGSVRAVQPFFLIDQEIIATAGPRIRGLVERVRKVWPRFMRMRALMVGCAAGEGHLDGTAALRPADADLLAAAAVRHGRALKAPMIVFKEFPARYRDTLAGFTAHGYSRIPSLPMTKLRIDYASFDDYLTQALSRSARKDIRRKFKATADAPKIEMEVLTDVSPVVDEIYPLYEAVYARSTLHFEKLTKEFLCELGRRMPDKARFFIWRQNGKAIAFSLCMVQDDTITDEYLGLDYSVALDLHLYHYTFRDVVSWAMAQGYTWYRSSSLNYDPKLHLRCVLDPLDLYARHTNPLFNAAMRRILPLVAPGGSDKTLERFPNYAELWGHS